MTLTNDCRGLDMGQLTPALLRSAMALVHDPEEASALVALTLQAASEADARAAPLEEADLFRLLRRAYHSIERSRPRRRIRDSLVTTLAAQQGQPGSDHDD